MRLKIEISGGLLSNMGKNRTRDCATIILLGFGLRVVQNNESNELRIVGRQITAERNDFFAFFVTPVWSNFLRGAGLARNGEAGNRRGCGGAAIAHDTAKRFADLTRGLWRNDLTQNDS